MKLIKFDDTHKISGGTKYIQVTSELTFKGIPQSCIDNFYHSNKANLTNILLYDYHPQIVYSCPEMESGRRHPTKAAQEIISFELVND
ncbi:MAG: hypothetical protein ACHQJ6_02110 [Candidatus Berkiellales bacterium]